MPVEDAPVNDGKTVAVVVADRAIELGNLGLPLACKQLVTIKASAFKFGGGAGDCIKVFAAVPHQRAAIING